MVRLSILILSIVFTLGLSSMLAYSHTDDAETIVQNFTCAVEEDEEPVDAEAHWWWCYDESDYDALHALKNGAFSLSMKLDVFDEGENLVITCEGETSTKSVDTLSGNFAARLEEACTAGECDTGVRGCHVEGVDLEEVFCGPEPQDVACLEQQEACDDAVETFESIGSFTYTGDVKAIHIGTGGPSGNASSSGGGGGLQHHKAMAECPEF